MVLVVEWQDAVERPRGKRRNAMTKKMSKEEKRVTELVRRRMKESRSTELLGFDVESVHAGRALFRLDVRPNHKQIHGVVHGGILAALADTTAAIAAYTVIPRGTEIATVELSINYLEPVPGGRIKAVARGKKFCCGRVRNIQRGRVAGRKGAAHLRSDCRAFPLQVEGFREPTRRR